MEFPKRILLNNGAWVKEKLELRPNFFKKMVVGQKPQALWLGCSDSRVPPEELTGVGPGELFVHRNVANLFTEQDNSVMSVLQYAVEALKVPYIVLCGHKGCGGVTAAAQGTATGVLKQWLDPISKLQPKTAPDMSEEQKVEQYILTNIEMGVRRLSQTPVVQNAWNSGQHLSILGWHYDTFSGHLEQQMCIQSPGDVKTANSEEAVPLEVTVSR